MKKEIKNGGKTEISFPNEAKETENGKVEKTNLKEAIKAAGYSRKKIGELLHVSERQVTNYIKGTTPIPEDSLFKLSELLNVSKSFILQITDKPEKGFEGIYHEICEREYSAYKPVYDLLENLNYEIEWDIKNANKSTIPVKIGKKGADTFTMDARIFDFLVKEIRNYADNLIGDYIEYMTSQEKLTQFLSKCLTGNNIEIADVALTKEGIPYNPICAPDPDHENHKQ